MTFREVKPVIPYFLLLFVAVPTIAEDLRLVTWNIESGGNKPSVIADQLSKLGPYDIVGLTEVDPANSRRYKQAMGDTYRSVLSSTGNKDRLMLLYDESKIQLIENYELVAHNGKRMNTVDFRYRSPLVGRYQHRQSGTEFLVVVVHLARGKEKIRQMQAEGMRTWAASQTVPVIAIGDFNFDYVFETEKGNKGFDVFLAGDTWKWVRPEKLVDTNWYDPEPDGVDNYPGSCLDFTFVAGAAKKWAAQSRVIERPGDFPDDDTTSDHRPVELLIEFGQPVPATTSTE